MALELGALHLAIRDQGGAEVLDKLRALDQQAKATDRAFVQIGQRKPLVPLTQNLKALNADLTAFIGDLKIVGSAVGQMGAAEVRAMRQAAAASIEHYRTLGATEAQQRRLTMAVAQFERQVNAAALAQDRMASASARQAAQVSVFGQRVTNAAGHMSGFGKVSLGAVNAVAFGLAQLAATGDMSFRSLASSASSVLAFFGPKGAIASAVISVGLAFTTAFRKARQEMEETRAKAAEEAQRMRREMQLAARTGDRGAIEAQARALQFGTVDKPGVIDLNNEVVRLTRERDAVNRELTAKQTQLSRAELQVLARRIADLDVQITNRTASRNALQRQIADLMRTVQEMAPQRERGLPEVKTETAAVGDLVAARSAEISALVDLAKLGLAHADDLARMASLEQAVTSEVARGNLALAAKADRLREIIALGEARTIALGGVGATVGPIAPPRPTATPGIDPKRFQVAAIPSQERLRELFAREAQERQVGKLLNEAIAREIQANAFAENLSAMLASAITSGIASGFANGFSAGSFAEGFRQATANFLSGLGAMAIEIGVKLKVLGQLMLWLNAHPWAALAVGIGMVAFGAAIGGRRGGATGGGTAGGGGFGARDDVTRLQVADRGFLPPSARPRNAAAAAMPAPVIINTTLLNPNDPATQRVLAQAMRTADRRGF